MTLYPKVLVVLDPSVAEQKALNRAVELAKLQDQVPPFSNAESRALIESALGKPILPVTKSI